MTKKKARLVAAGGRKTPGSTPPAAAVRAATRRIPHFKRRVPEPCPHIKALLAEAVRLGVEIGGCGCCGSPWVDCTQCEITVEGPFLPDTPRPATQAPRTRS